MQASQPMRSAALLLLFGLALVLASSCKKGPVELSSDARDMFWIKNEEADIPVWVRGNTSSKTFVVMVTGKPGEGSTGYAGEVTAQIRQNYAVVFWDYRNSGAAGGGLNIPFLNLSNASNDLHYVIRGLRKRYGEDSKVFLYGHSFGGYIGTRYMSTWLETDSISGWIAVASNHNYLFSNMLGRRMLIETAAIEIASGRNIDRWTEIDSFCKSIDSAVSNYNDAVKLNEYQLEAEALVGVGEHRLDPEYSVSGHPFNRWANMYQMYQTAGPKDFLALLENENLLGYLPRVKVPTIIFHGQFDFYTPLEIAKEAHRFIATREKELVICPNSGHFPMIGDKDLVQQKTIEFIEAHK